MKDLLKSTVQWLCLCGVTQSEIRNLLLSKGLTEYEAFLTFRGAQIIAKSILSERRLSK